MKKHLGKMLVFFLNLFLMAAAVLVIENKDQERRAAQAEKKLREENDSLKYELDTLKGALESVETQAENAVESITQNVEPTEAKDAGLSQSAPSPAVSPATGTTSVSPSAKSPTSSKSSKASSSSASSAKQNSVPAPDAKTKTS